MTFDLDLQMAQLEVKLLRAQFNSHFLFNNLSAINFCILQNDNQKASSYLTLFSRFLRRLAGNSRQDFVRLSEEIEMLKQYVQIENLRFARSLRLTVSIESGIEPEEVWVPSLILHSHLENMIWQNMESQTAKGVLVLKIKKKSEKYHILLKTKGLNFGTSDSRVQLGNRESGLNLTLERLQLLNARHGTDLQMSHSEASVNSGGQVILSFSTSPKSYESHSRR